VNWKKEALRDLEALGSFVFYIVIAARSLIGMHWKFLAHAALALVISLVLWQILKRTTGIKASSHASNFFIMLILVNAFYQAWLFGIFTIVLFGFVLYAHTQLRKHKKSEFISGIIIGLVSIAAAWGLTSLAL